MSKARRVGASLGLAALFSALAPAADVPQADRDRALAKAEFALKAYQQARVFFLERRLGIDTAYLWSIRALDTKLALCQNEDERTSALQAHVEDMQGIERIMKAAGRVGQTNQLEFSSVAYYRIEAMQWLAHGRPK